ncbi:ABC transporter [Streptomyces yokosukanensis]|uniref:Transport permease protein n=1 Tax=Streptomyces yokosukanensis TaxID=67386 RepID=A0A101NSD3_9ACTN|nr:ABC transporter [Streptomyces yokosukanensis]
MRPAPTGVRSATRTFFFILWRDLFVTGRELGTFLAQILVEPFFILFVFGKVLGELGYTGGAFQSVLLPGVVALNAFLVGLQNTALPMIIDFSFSKEIEDRLLAPIPITLVAVEKLVFGTLRGIVASLLMIPMGFLVLDHAFWPMDRFPATLGVLLLGALAGSAVGLTIGTLAPPRHISVVFAVVLTPLMFTGCTQFPWHGLAGIRWFQVLCALNPLTYVTEGIRDLLLPPGGPRSIPLWVDLAALAASILIFGAISIKGFHRRAQD